MASTTADRTLGRGAYAAAGGNIEDYGLAASKGMTKIGEAIGDPIAKKIQERTKYFEDFANWELSRNTGLNDEEFQLLTEDLNRRKTKYALSGNKDRAMMMREMQEQKTQLDSLNNAKKKLASNVDSNSSSEGVGEDFLASDTNASLVEAMKSSPVDDGNGNLGYMVWTPEDGEVHMTGDQIEKLLDKYEYDTTSKNVLMETINKALSEAENPNAKFNYDETQLSVRNNIIDKGKTESLINREMIPGRTFYNDVQESLIGTEYQAFGISEDMLNNIDENLDNVKLSDGISPEEAKIITDELLKDKDLTKDYLTRYYTNFIEQNFNKKAQDFQYTDLPMDIKQRLRTGNTTTDNLSNTGVTPGEKQQYMESRINLQTGEAYPEKPKWQVWSGGEI